MAQSIDKLDQIHIGKKGAAPISAPGWTAKPESRVKLVDCDVHHNFREPEELLPYLPKFYQDHLRDQGLHLPGSGYANIPYRRTRPRSQRPATQRARFQLLAGIHTERIAGPLEYRLCLADRTAALLRLRRFAGSRLGCRAMQRLQRLDH